MRLSGIHIYDPFLFLLRPQHLSGLQLLRDMSHGHLENGEVGSTEISFFPKTMSGGSYIADTKTAG